MPRTSRRSLRQRNAVIERSRGARRIRFNALPSAKESRAGASSTLDQHFRYPDGTIGVWGFDSRGQFTQIQHERRRDGDARTSARNRRPLCSESGLLAARAFGEQVVPSRNSTWAVATSACQLILLNVPPKALTVLDSPFDHQSNPSHKGLCGARLLR